MYFLSYACGSRKMKEEKKKMNKIKIFKFDFKLLELLCLVFLGVVPIPYVSGFDKRGNFAHGTNLQ